MKSPAAPMSAKHAELRARLVEATKTEHIDGLRAVATLLYLRKSETTAPYLHSFLNRLGHAGSEITRTHVLQSSLIPEILAEQGFIDTSRLDDARLHGPNNTPHAYRLTEAGKALSASAATLYADQLAPLVDSVYESEVQRVASYYLRGVDGLPTANLVAYLASINSLPRTAHEIRRIVRRARYDRVCMHMSGDEFGTLLQRGVVVFSDDTTPVVVRPSRFSLDVYSEMTEQIGNDEQRRSPLARFDRWLTLPHNLELMDRMPQQLDIRTESILQVPSSNLLDLVR